jgi:hypothetical protein
MKRRSFVFGLVGVFAAPSIVKASSLMGIKAFSEPFDWGPPSFHQYDIPLEKSLGMFDLTHYNKPLALKQLQSMVDKGQVVRSNTGVIIQ